MIFFNAGKNTEVWCRLKDDLHQMMILTSQTPCVAMLHSSSEFHECFMDASYDCTCYNILFFKLLLPVLPAQNHSVPTPTFTTVIPTGTQTENSSNNVLQK